MNVVMLAYSGSDFQKSLTQTSIESLRGSAPSGDPALDDMKITVVESGPEDFAYAKIDCVVRYRGEGGFNYNKALNQGAAEAEKRFGRPEWWCFTNNDVVFGEEWLAEIGKALSADPGLGAVSPNERFRGKGVDVGYVLGKNFAGCCFLLRGQVADRLLPFDEDFFFYFQDEDILERLRADGVRSGRVLSSRVSHVGSQTGKPDVKTLIAGRDQFIRKYSKQTYIQNEAAKRAFWKECGEIK